MEELLKPDPKSCLNPKSPLAMLNGYTNEGYKLLCSEECPCNGNPEIFKEDPLIEVVVVGKGNETCSGSPSKRCLYFDYKGGMFNAQKCYEKRWGSAANKAGSVSAGQEEHEAYMKILKNLEETNECSGGLCDGGDESNFLPTYVFSNINNGIPTKSCHKSLRHLVITDLDSYLLGFIIPLFEAVSVTFVYTCLILYRIWKKCCHRKRKANAKKRRQEREKQVAMGENGAEIELELDQQEQLDSDETDSSKKPPKNYKAANFTESSPRESQNPDQASASPSSAQAQQNKKQKRNADVEVEF